MDYVAAAKKSAELFAINYGAFFDYETELTLELVKAAKDDEELKDAHLQFLIAKTHAFSAFHNSTEFLDQMKNISDNFDDGKEIFEEVIAFGDTAFAAFLEYINDYFSIMIEESQSEEEKNFYESRCNNWNVFQDYADECYLEAVKSYMNEEDAE